MAVLHEIMQVMLILRNSCKYARRAKNIRKCIQILAHFYLDCTLRHCYNKVWPNVRFIEKGLRDLFGKPGVLS